jgi:hypothetical protein
MSGYRDRTSFDPSGRTRPSTRLEKAVAVLAIVAGLLLMFSVFAGSKNAPAYLRQFDWGIAPLGLVEWGMAWVYIERAGANRPDERYSQRTLRFTALAFFLLGLIIIGVGINHHFQGA